MNEKLAYADQTLVHPLGLVLFLAMAAFLMTARRSRALIPVFILTCLIPPAQRVSILGLDFTLLRLLLVVGWMRVISRGEARDLRLIALDRVLIAYVVVGSLANIALFGTAAKVVFNLGIAFDVVSSYFLVRILLRSLGDLDVAIGGLAWITIALVVPFLLERHVEPHRNLFSVFGGLSEFTQAREGKVRAQGAFPHSIVAGCFFATLLPILLARFWTRPGRVLLPVAACASALLIVHTTSSSTPIAGAAAALGAAAFFRFRHHLAMVRWGALFGLVGLQLVMNAPVWHLISRIDLVGGSTGWHRYHLIDQAIRRFPEWAVLGTRSTAHWGHALGDVTNQYVFEGVSGGFLGLALFVAMIVLAFRGIGRALRAARGHRPREILVWMVGASVFAHAGIFLAVSYFGQMYWLWYFTLGAVASLEERATSPRRVPAVGPRRALAIPSRPALSIPPHPSP